MNAKLRPKRIKFMFAYSCVPSAVAMCSAETIVTSYKNIYYRNCSDPKMLGGGN